MNQLCRVLGCLRRVGLSGLISVGDVRPDLGGGCIRPRENSSLRSGMRARGAAGLLMIGSANLV